VNTSTLGSDLLLTLNEAAQRLAISRRTLEREIAAGRFPLPIKVRRATRVRASQIDQYIFSLGKEASPK
jgi:excisionase family DNA binding protein